MAQPLEGPGAIQSADRPLGRVVRVFFSPRTSVSPLIRTQRSMLPWLPCSPGMRQCESTIVIRASGNRALICLPRGDAVAAGSA